MSIKPNPAVPNGTRAKILILLAKEGPLTTNEISEHLGITAKQVRDNSNQARNEKLIQSGQDCVTGLLAYSITPSGREWVKSLRSIKSQSDEPGKDSQKEIADEADDDEADEIVPTADLVTAIDLNPEPESTPGTSEEFSPVAVDVVPDEAPAIADATEEDRELYVVFGASMPVPEIAGPTLDDAQHQCISMAFDSGCDLTLYRLVPVGNTRTSVTFVLQ